MGIDDHEVKDNYPCPKDVHPDDWDEEAGEVIKDVRVMGGKAPHNASHFFQTIRVLPPGLEYNGCIGEKLEKDPNWEYDKATKRWRYDPTPKQ